MKKVLLVLAMVATLMSCSDKTKEMLIKEVAYQFPDHKVEVLSYTIEEVPTVSLEESIIEHYEDRATEMEINKNKAKQRGRVYVWKAYQESYRDYSKKLDSVRAIVKEYPTTRKYEVLIKFEDEHQQKYFKYERIEKI